MCLIQERIDECKGALTIANVAFGAKRAEPKDVDTYGFKKDPKDFNVYWDVRKGLIPIVGAARETGLWLALCCVAITLTISFCCAAVTTIICASLTHGGSMMQFVESLCTFCCYAVASLWHCCFVFHRVPCC